MELCQSLELMARDGACTARRFVCSAGSRSMVLAPGLWLFVRTCLEAVGVAAIVAAEGVVLGHVLLAEELRRAHERLRLKAERPCCLWHLQACRQAQSQKDGLAGYILLLKPSCEQSGSRAMAVA